MITNKNQACFTKKSGCGLQEESNRSQRLTSPIQRQEYYPGLNYPCGQAEHILCQEKISRLFQEVICRHIFLDKKGIICYTT